MANEIVALCLTRFIDSESGALREYFSLDWSPFRDPDGHIVEPGHQYEWAFLLDLWAVATKRPRPAAVSRLIGFADRHGIDPVRRVALNGVLTDGSVYDAGVRLWPQTERLRAYIAIGAPDALIEEAVGALARHLTVAMPGLWIERFTPDGDLIDEPARATSLYHIMGAIGALLNGRPEGVAATAGNVIR